MALPHHHRRDGDDRLCLRRRPGHVFSGWTGLKPGLAVVLAMLFAAGPVMFLIAIIGLELP